MVQKSGIHHLRLVGYIPWSIFFFRTTWVPGGWEWDFEKASTVFTIKKQNSSVSFHWSFPHFRFEVSGLSRRREKWVAWQRVECGGSHVGPGRLTQFYGWPKPLSPTRRLKVSDVSHCSHSFPRILISCLYNIYIYIYLLVFFSTWNAMYFGGCSSVPNHLMLNFLVDRFSRSMTAVERFLGDLPTVLNEDNWGRWELVLGIWRL